MYVFLQFYSGKSNVFDSRILKRSIPK